MAHCTDALSRAWTRMVSLLFLPFRLLFWIKMAILFLILGGLNPFNYITQRFGAPSDPDEYRELMENFIERLPLLIFLILLFVIGSILFSLLYAASRFIFYDSVRNGTCYYLASFNRHVGGILSYLLWNIAVLLIVTIVILGLLAILLLLGFLLLDSLGTGVVVILALSGVGLFFIFMLTGIIYWTLLDAMVLPMMVVEQVGIFEAWRRALALAFSRIGEFLGFMVIRTLIHLCLGIILFLIGIFIAGASLLIAIGSGVESDPEMFIQVLYSAAALPVWLILAFIQLPVPVFLDAYAFIFVGGLTGKTEYFPPNDQVQGQDHDYDSESAATSPSTPDRPTPQTPMGPVNFSDIPSEPDERREWPGSDPPNQERYPEEPR